MQNLSKVEEEKQIKVSTRQFKLRASRSQDLAKKSEDHTVTSEQKIIAILDTNVDSSASEDNIQKWYKCNSQKQATWTRHPTEKLLSFKEETVVYTLSRWPPSISRTNLSAFITNRFRRFKPKQTFALHRHIRTQGKESASLSDTREAADEEMNKEKEPLKILTLFIY